MDKFSKIKPVYSVSSLEINRLWMNNVLHLTILLFLTTLFHSATAQKTAVYSDQNTHYKTGIEFYEKGLYGIAQKEFLKVINTQKMPNQGSTPLSLVEKAKLYFAMSAIRLERPDGERLALDFIRQHEPAAIANEAKFELANYYYAAENFKNALAFYETIDKTSLTREQSNEVQFKRSYSYFLRKKFIKARAGFAEITGNKDKYYYPSNYYYGVSAFFENDYSDALQAFKKVNASKKYSKVVPYYITQIHFAQGEYQELIDFAKPLLKDESIKYTQEMGQLVGQAHFELGQYSTALPYLEAYVEEVGKLSEKEIYQLAYCQYKTGNFEAAIQNFEKIKEVDSKFGQNAVYNLADSYLKTDRKATARSAFQTCAKNSYDKEIQEDCLFNYAKLSFELNKDRDAMSALVKIPKESANYNEAQRLLSKIFLDTRDYVKTMEIIEGLPNKTQPIETAYQRIAYLRGVQLYMDNKLPEAARHFNIAIMNNQDPEANALATYWLGELDYKRKNYPASIAKMNEFIQKSKSLSNLPLESSVATANYTIGYCYLKENSHNKAVQYFDACSQAIGGRTTGNEYIDQNVYPDAVMRSGDCYFKANNYSKALSNYDKVIQSKYRGYDYALFQKGMILGLLKPDNPIEKILVLETLYKENPESYYADDGLNALGVTYLKMEKFSEAQTVYRKLIDNYPESDLVNASYVKLGLISVNLNDPTQGLAYYKKAMKTNPDPKTSKDALKGIEGIYVNQGNADDYFSYVESVPGYKVTDIARDSVLFKAAESQYASAEYETSITAYDKYLKKFPSGPNSLISHFKRGESYFALKKYDSALEDYKAVLSRGKSKFEEASARNGALIAYNIQQQFPAALKLFVQYFEAASTPENQHEAELGIMRSGYRCKDQAKVNESTDLIVKNKLSTKLEKAEANYAKAKLAMAAKDYNNAREGFNKVIKYTEDERAAEARYEIAHIYFLDGDLEIAQQLCLNTNQQIAGYEYWLAKSVLLLSDIFAKTGDTFNAKASLESIIENYTGDAELIASAKAKLAKLKAAQPATAVTTPVDTTGNLEMDAPIEEEQEP